MDITGIDLSNQNAGMACAKVRLRYTLKPLVSIYLIKMWVWHVQKLDSDVDLHKNHWY